MTTHPPTDVIDDQLELLLAIAGHHALKNTPIAEFQEWFVLAAPSIAPAFVKQLPQAQTELTQVLRFLASELYAHLPMPNLALQAPGRAKQGRNDACACGSGQKFKNCCGSGSMPPPLFGSMNLLRYVLDVYPKSRLPEVATSKANIAAVAHTAHQWMEKGEYVRVSMMLEPYFSGDHPLGERLSPLFDLLMDVWADQGRRGKREKLIEQILLRGDRALKSDALQRRTTMCADKGNFTQAWDSFKQASLLNPNDPALSFLEVSVLAAQGRVHDAQARAQWWADFLSKQRDPQLSDLIATLRDMVNDPHKGMLDVAMTGDDDLRRLNELFRAAPSPVVRHHLDVAEQEGEDGRTHRVVCALVPDPELAKLEKRWQKVFLQAKPSLTAVQNNADQVWVNAGEWLSLLQKHPSLWLSFDVLDDLIMALDTVDLAGVQERLLVLMAERVAEQLRITLQTDEGNLKCPWGFLDNRPVLRPIAHLALLCSDAGKWQRFMELARWLVQELNPDDNHGLRSDLSCAYVRFGRWQDVLALEAQYPNDSTPTLGLNAVLATFALGQAEQARKLLKEAKHDYPVATKMLLAAAAPKPVKQDSPYGIQIGGKYEAWLYVSQMRECWEKNKALEWARTG